MHFQNLTSTLTFNLKAKHLKNVFITEQRKEFVTEKYVQDKAIGCSLSTDLILINFS